MRSHDGAPHGYVADSPRDARRFVRRVLDDLGCQEVAEDAELLVSEVVTNAVLHGGGASTPVRVERIDDGVRIEVVDPGHVFPAEPQEVDLSTPGGLGLSIVDNLSDRWGVTPTDQGKVVWFELVESAEDGGPSAA